LIGFPFFEAQAKWIAQVLSGKSSLPSPDQMLQSVDEFYRSRDLAGVPKHNTHDIADFTVVNKTFLTIFFNIFVYFWFHCPNKKVCVWISLLIVLR